MKILALGLVLIVTPWPVAAQNRQRPPRDNQAPAPSGTGRIVGRVTAADTGSPLRLAQVRISSPDLRLTRAASTNADGRYDFTELPPGRYSITVSKAGFVMAQFGQQGTFDPGKPVELREGQALEGIDFTLSRGSVITGRVSDDYGEPVAQAQVVAARYQYDSTGQRRLSNVMANGTDDLGRFRIFGLPPGDYIVSATLRAPMMMASTDTSSASNVSDGYAPTYYPGVPNAAEAQALTLGVGQESTADFSLLPAHMARVSGTVIDSQGKPMSGGTVTLTMSSGMGFMGAPVGAVRADGSFSIANVPPGEHTLNVRNQMRGGGPDTEFASVPIVVSGENITGLQIVTGRGASVSGHVTFDGSSARPGSVTIVSLPLDRQGPGAGMPSGGPQGNGVAGADGKFQMRGLFGKIMFRANLPSGWTLKSVSLEGNDITDVPLDLHGSENLTTVEVVVTDRLTEVSGTIKDSHGQPVTSYVVVLLPRDVHDGTLASRFIRIARPDQDGRFLVRGLPPGDYVATAVASLEQGREFDPDMQERLRAGATRVTLKEGESASLNLELASH